LAAALRAAEAAVERERPGAAVVIGDSDGALAAALTAVKLGVPVASVAGSTAVPGEPPLVTLVADGTIAASGDPAEVADAVEAWLAPILSGP
jgi:alkanesulfonate monooxygenase SsuD/methylene tetrahydromethanopterin reductase-like flavin-dependent oxidoreductase (luciferase family)